MSTSTTPTTADPSVVISFPKPRTNRTARTRLLDGLRSGRNRRTHVGMSAPDDG